MPSRLHAVAFDLDGLMFNTEDLYQDVGSEILRRRGKEFTDELLDQMMGRKSTIALQIMIDFHSLDDTPQSLATESDLIFQQILNDRLELMPGLVELLDALERSQMPKAVVTSSRRSFASDVLGRFDLESRFAFVLAGEDVAHGKPDPDVYLTAADRLGVRPADMLVLEDSENGCRAAVAAGAFAVAVPTSRSRHHNFDGARLVADTLADPRIYEALGLAVSGE